ncbi:hypothetical protein XELAEV_18018781mg [Xenopus laevis]|uniref:Uncharacterized protein n=1 Tax=Xenopus laevis TaxID=8355 RepID=A0A974DFH1_XENLA|nr:hypothetical protein XELAEV_18018781mg [Xenopus laevis]
MAIKDILAQKDNQILEVRFYTTGSDSSTEITVSTHHGAEYVENRISITLSSATPTWTTMECNTAALGNVRKRKAWQISEAEESSCSFTQSGCHEMPNEKGHSSTSQCSPHPLADRNKASASTTPGENKSWTEKHAKKNSNGQKRKQGKQTSSPSVSKMKASSANTFNELAREANNKDDPAPAEEQITPVQQHSTQTCTHFHCTYEHSSNAGALTWFLKLFSL